MTLMIESELDGEGALTNEELKVRKADGAAGRSDGEFHGRATFVFSSWLDMTQQPMRLPLPSTTWQRILYVSANHKMLRNLTVYPISISKKRRDKRP